MDSPLPATDYWFVVDYPEDGIIKNSRHIFKRDSKSIGGRLLLL
jgi:hypothetical protein